MRTLTLSVSLDETTTDHDKCLASVGLDIEIPDGAKINAKLLCSLLTGKAMELLQEGEEHLLEGDGEEVSSGLIKFTHFSDSCDSR